MSNIDSKYSIEIRKPDGALLAEFAGRAVGREFSIIRNRPEVIKWRISLESLKEVADAISATAESLLAVNQNEVHIRRKNTNLIAGQIVHVQTVLAGADKWVEVRAVGFLNLFADRLTASEKVYTDTDAGQIAWNLINTTQQKANGDYGITQGTIQASVNRTRTYQYKNIKEAIIQLSEVDNGFDFEFTFDKKFNVYHPKIGVQNAKLIFRYPGTIKRMTIPKSGVNIVNEVVARGEGFGAAQVVKIRSNAASQTKFFLRQKTLDLPSVKESVTLQEHGDSELDLFKEPIEVAEVIIDGNQSPFLKEDYWIGDEIKVEAEEVITAKHLKDNFYRIDAIQVTIDDNDSEEISLKLFQV